MMEIENHHLINTTVIIIAVQNLQGMLLVGYNMMKKEICDWSQRYIDILYLLIICAEKAQQHFSGVLAKTA